MNFLSHYYFERNSGDCYHTLGTVLPDLLKNADKSIIIHPEKLSHAEAGIQSIILGWKKHLEVDRYFHSSDFFTSNSHQLKKLLVPAIEGSPVKPFFLGHVTVELILDSLLLTHNRICVQDFYDQLDACDEFTINNFLVFSGLPDSTCFFKFFSDFKASRYLTTYTDTTKIAYALKRICMRIWNNPFTQVQEARINEVVSAYTTLLDENFMEVFELIENKFAQGN